MDLSETPDLPKPPESPKNSEPPESPKNSEPPEYNGPNSNYFDQNTTYVDLIPDIAQNYLNFDKNLKMPSLEFILNKKFDSEKSILISNKIKEKIEKLLY